MSTLSRKKLLQRDDAFLKAAGESAKWLGSHRVQLAVVIVALVVVVGAIWGGVEYKRGRDATASQDLAKGMALLDAQISAEQPAGPEGKPPSFASEKDKWTAARAQFEKVLAKSSGSGVAALARYYVLDLDEKLGNKQAAEQGFLKLAGTLPSDDNLYFLAIERAAYLQEARGAKDEAIATWERLAASTAHFYADYATYEQARLHLEKGDTDRARSLLERIQKDFPNSSVMEEVRTTLARIGGPTAAASAPAAAGESVAKSQAKP